MMKRKSILNHLQIIWFVWLCNSLLLLVGNAKEESQDSTFNLAYIKLAIGYASEIDECGLSFQNQLKAHWIRLNEKYINHQLTAEESYILFLLELNKSRWLRSKDNEAQRLIDKEKCANLLILAARKGHAEAQGVLGAHLVAYAPKQKEGEEFLHASILGGNEYAKSVLNYYICTQIINGDEKERLRVCEEIENYPNPFQTQPILLSKQKLADAYLVGYGFVKKDVTRGLKILTKLVNVPLSQIKIEHKWDYVNMLFDLAYIYEQGIYVAKDLTARDQYLNKGITTDVILSPLLRPIYSGITLCNGLFLVHTNNELLMNVGYIWRGACGTLWRKAMEQEMKRHNMWITVKFNPTVTPETLKNAFDEAIKTESGGIQFIDENRINYAMVVPKQVEHEYEKISCLIWGDKKIDETIFKKVTNKQRDLTVILTPTHILCLDKKWEILQIREFMMWLQEQTDENSRELRLVLDEHTQLSTYKELLFALKHYTAYLVEEGKIRTYLLDTVKRSYIWFYINKLPNNRVLKIEQALTTLETVLQKMFEGMPLEEQVLFYEGIVYQFVNMGLVWYDGNKNEYVPTFVQRCSESITINGFTLERSIEESKEKAEKEIMVFCRKYGLKDTHQVVEEINKFVDIFSPNFYQLPEGDNFKTLKSVDESISLLLKDYTYSMLYEFFKSFRDSKTGVE